MNKLLFLFLMAVLEIVRLDICVASYTDLKGPSYSIQVTVKRAKVLVGLEDSEIKAGKIVVGEESKPKLRKIGLIKVRCLAKNISVSVEDEDRKPLDVEQLSHCLLYTSPSPRD